MRRSRFGAGGRLLRLALAILLAMLVVGFSTLGLFVGSAPAWLSMAVEPVSLLLVPGMVFAMAEMGPHDFSPDLVVLMSFVFYVVFFYAALTFRSRRQPERGERNDQQAAMGGRDESR